MKEFKNCISPRILYLGDPLETLVEHSILPPELYLFIGIISMFVKILLSLWPRFESWLKTNCIMFRGYHGIGLDGKNAQRFLDNLDNLEINLMSAASIDPKIRLLLPVISCTRKFSIVKTKGFGMKVEKFLCESILDFKEFKFV